MLEGEIGDVMDSTKEGHVLILVELHTQKTTVFPVLAIARKSNIVVLGPWIVKCV